MKFIYQRHVMAAQAAGACGEPRAVGESGNGGKRQKAGRQSEEASPGQLPGRLFATLAHD